MNVRYRIPGSDTLFDAANKKATMRNASYGILLGLLLAAEWASAQMPQEVKVSVKFIEFQSSKTGDMGLSAYFRRRSETAWGKTTTPSGITTADVTFPKSNTLGINVFFDKLMGHYGDFELVLQGLVDQGRAFVLAKPQILVKVGAAAPSVIETTNAVPYEETKVVGYTPQQVTSFTDTGVKFTANVVAVQDDDGKPDTKENNFIQLKISAAVSEEGPRIPIGLDARLTSEAGNFLRVPQFYSRSIETTVWVREEQVLILGGLYFNRKSKDISTLPGLIQGEDYINATVQRFSPIKLPEIPLSSTLGKDKTDVQRRELVFALRADLWKPTQLVPKVEGIEGAPGGEEAEKKKVRPADVITGVLQGIGGLPENVVQEISGEKKKEDVSESLGKEKEEK